jgi:hypothetical protein
MTTVEDIKRIAGPVAAQEYETAEDIYKPELAEWAARLQGLTDEELRAEAGTAILNSAVVQKFRGNWEHEHFKATAAYWESKRRHTAAGHDKGCRSGTIYALAYNDVARSQGLSQAPEGSCDCERVA